MKLIKQIKGYLFEEKLEPIYYEMKYILLRKQKKNTKRLKRTKI
jgi:hypothetical protein